MTRKDAKSKLETERNRKLYVGGLPYEITKEELGNYFSVFGELEYANIVYSVGSTLPRGFGFIKFKAVSSAEDALEFGKHT
jgi:RNA recognition motif-containing protein